MICVLDKGMRELYNGNHWLSIDQYTEANKFSAVISRNVFAGQQQTSVATSK